MTTRPPRDDADAAHRDPRPYLARLVPDPDKFMCAMRDYLVLISGSGASGFFYETSRNENSDWDMYCSGGCAYAAAFSVVMLDMGASWVGPSEDGYEGLRVLSGRLGDQSIQLMWHDNAMVTSLEIIMEFHSSIVQCFISGWCAVSMYHGPSSQGKMFAWNMDKVPNRTKRMKAPMCVAKYVDRGFEVVPYSVSLLGLAQGTFAGLAMPWTPRSMSDAGCLVVDFKSYLGYADPGLDLLHEAAMREIMSMEWAELKDGSLRMASVNPRSGNRSVYSCIRMSMPSSVARLIVVSVTRDPTGVDHPSGTSITLTLGPPVPVAQGDHDHACLGIGRCSVPVAHDMPWMRGLVSSPHVAQFGDINWSMPI